MNCLQGGERRNLEDERRWVGNNFLILNDNINGVPSKYRYNIAILAWLFAATDNGFNICSGLKLIQ